MQRSLNIIFLILLVFYRQSGDLLAGSSANDHLGSFTGGGDSIPSIQVIDQLDTVKFDFVNAVCTSTYIQIPVSIASDDAVYALDFALKYNPSEIVYHSFVNHKPYLNIAANYNAADSTIRFSSFSFSQPIESNTPLLTLRFDYGSVNQVSFATFDSVESQLNGDYCSKTGLSAGLTQSVLPGGTPVITPGDSIQLSIALQAGQTSTWSNGATGPVTWVYNPGLYSVTVTNTNGCSGSSFLTVTAPSPLPVELLYFKGIQQGEVIRLEWATASETNNRRFSIEKIRAENQWTVIGEKNGSGNTSTISHYYYDDVTATAGTNIYRLVQLDYDGNAVSSIPVLVEFRTILNNSPLISIYPNPAAKYNIHINVIKPVPTMSGTVKLFQLTGQIIFQLPISHPGKTEFNMSVPIPESLPAGFYIVNYSDGNINLNTSLIIK